MPVQLWQQPLESVAYAAGFGQTKDRKWQKQDEKEGREQNESDMNVGNIDEEDNL
mgnify:CR=1 FL=1